jgi:SAM-dependent methyltransferase
MAPDPQKVRVWDARAAAYDRLCRRWEIFSLLSNRLVDLLPADLSGPVLDLGCGTGTTSQALLDRHPRCQAILIDPAEAMVNLARLNLAGRPAQFFPIGLDEISVRGLHVVAALASASMQFIDFEPAFDTLGRIVAPRGHVAFNLWWHHWEETAARECMTDSREVAEAVCREFRLPPPPPRALPTNVKNRSELMDASHRHGFRLLTEHRDEYPTPIGFGLDFDAMDVDWPVKGLSQDGRDALLAKMHEVSAGTFETLISTRFLLQKTA